MDFIYITYRDGQVFRFAIDVIYRHRAKRFAWQYNNDLDATIEKFIKPKFDENPRFLYEYVEMQMTWDDVKAHIERVEVNPIAIDRKQFWHEAIKHSERKLVPA